MQKEVSFYDIIELSQKLNLRVIGVSNCETLLPDKYFLESWQKNKYFASMEYMSRDSSILSNPSYLINDKTNIDIEFSNYSVISLALDYSSNTITDLKKGFGKVARYAWGDDYHLVFKDLLIKLSIELKEFGYLRSFTDAVPLLERALANRGSKSTFIGKNSMLIEPKNGSMFLLGELICGFKVKEIPIENKKNHGCKTCSKCMNQCPTGAIVAEKTVDANKCISFLTIENKKIFTEKEITMIGDWIFGCDICQEVCPFNFTIIKNRKKFKNLLGENTLINNGLINIDRIISIDTNDKFNKIFNRSPLKRAKRRGLIRNALAVAINQSYKIDKHKLENLIQDQDIMAKDLVNQYNKLI